MQECLGISINNKLIRYARVSKNNDIYNVTSYGVKFYDCSVTIDVKQKV